MVTYLNYEIALLSAIKKENKDLALKIINFIQNKYKINYSKTFLKSAYMGFFKVKKETALKKINKMGFIYGDVNKTIREIVKFPKKIECLYYKVLPYKDGYCLDGKRAIFQTYNKTTRSFEDIANIKDNMAIVCEYDFAKSKNYYFEKPTRKVKTLKFLNCSF